MKIFLDTIGCRLNQAEIESLAQQFRAAGHEIVPSAVEADLAVINTCSVTGKAASDSRAAIRRVNRLGTLSTIVTGCWATLEPQKAGAIQGVTQIVPNSQKDRLVVDLLGLPQDFFDQQLLARQPIPGPRQRTRAFIKAQDGCDNACTFCITTLARGASRSLPSEDILLNVQAALKGGTNEIVLTGVQLGSWGKDFIPPQSLSKLVSELLEPGSIPRLRMSSLESWDLNKDFFGLWSDSHLCRHLHLPLQSGSATVLKRMGRKTTPDEFAELVESARSIIPDVAITTDLISGFPGETETEFRETMDFVKTIGFAGGHVFPYSSRPGTSAARMKGQVNGELKQMRAAILRSLLVESAQAYRRKFIGKTMSVIWEARSTLTDSGWQVEGLTDNYIRVLASVSSPRWNRIDKVFLLKENSEYLMGEIQK